MLTLARLPLVCLTLTLLTLVWLGIDSADAGVADSDPAVLDLPDTNLANAKQYNTKD